MNEAHGRRSRRVILKQDIIRPNSEYMRINEVNMNILKGFQCSLRVPRQVYTRSVFHLEPHPNGLEIFLKRNKSELDIELSRTLN